MAMLNNEIDNAVHSLKECSYGYAKGIVQAAILSLVLAIKRYLV
jgi:porphobilinogen deaminase